MDILTKNLTAAEALVVVGLADAIVEAKPADFTDLVGPLFLAATNRVVVAKDADILGNDKLFAEAVWLQVAEFVRAGIAVKAAASKVL